MDPLPGTGTQTKLKGLLGRLGELGGLEQWIVKGNKASADSRGMESQGSAADGTDDGVVAGVMEELKRTMERIGEDE